MSARDPRNQVTLAAEAVVEGVGYWSGQSVRVALRPAAVNSGLTLCRDDRPDWTPIPVHVGARIEAQRRTVLALGGATAEMVEHVLAALHGLGIDNCEIGLSAAELPGLDGSAQAFVDAIRQVGYQVQPAEARTLVVREPLRVGDHKQWIEARPPVEPGEFTVDMTIHYPDHPVIGWQRYALRVTPESFAQELAGCRTFVLKHEADWMLQQGLATHCTPRDLLILDEGGPRDNTLRFPDECVRHKALDLVGDLAMVGCRVQGRFVAHCSGHRHNAELAWALLNEADQLEMRRQSA